MTYQVAKDTADLLAYNAKKQGDSPSINFFGGEPLLMWSKIIVPLTLYIRETYHNAFSLSMTSNGVELSEDKMQFMKENGIGLLFSIDGDKETQDYNRPLQNGNSSFDAVKDKIPLLHKYFKSLTFRSTVIPETCDKLFENIEFAVRSGFQEYFVMPNCFEVWDDKSKTILTQEMRKFSNYYISSYRENSIPIYFKTFEKCFKQILWVNSAVDRDSYREMSSCVACGKCGLGTSKYAAVDPSGNIYSCQELTSNDGPADAFYIGNLYSGVSNELRYTIANAFDQNDVIGANCDSCNLNRICDGGCVANNFLINGNVNSVPDIYCFWCQLLFNEAVYVMTELGSAKNQSFKNHWEETVYG